MGDASVEKSTRPASPTLLRRLAEVIGTRQQQLDLAQKTGLPFGTLKYWGAGRTFPPADKLEVLAGAVGHPPGWFFDEGGVRVAPERDDLLLIPRLDVEAAAGDGQSVDVVASVAELPFPRELVERMAPRGADLQCLQSRGDSMWPTIQDGALIVIDLKQRTLAKWQVQPRKSPRLSPKKDPIYVFNQSGLVRLKRLRDLGENFVAVLSDNIEAHPPEIVRQGRDGGLKIIGRVVWWDVRG